MHGYNLMLDTSITSSGEGMVVDLGLLAVCPSIVNEGPLLHTPEVLEVLP